METRTAKKNVFFPGMRSENPIPVPRPRRPQHIFVDLEGRRVRLDKAFKPEYKAVLRQQLGMQMQGKVAYTQIDPCAPLGGAPLVCGERSPICQQCRLFEHCADHPFMAYSGSANPLVTVIWESVAAADDRQNEFGTEGTYAGGFKQFIRAVAPETGVALEDVRFVLLTRCANRLRKPVNYKTKGNHCRLFLLQDLKAHPPRLVMPVGSAALGLLSHKSNAQDWGGRVLTWRGWPDDWLTEPAYVKPRTLRVGPNKSAEEIEVLGHPLLGLPPGPDDRCILYPVQSPRVIYAAANAQVTRRWQQQIVNGLKLARAGVKPLNYNFKHYRILEDPAQVAEALRRIIQYPGLLVAYDTETEGLHPFLGERIVFMMLRYCDPEAGKPVAIGFPWDYDADPERGPASPLKPFLAQLAPLVLKALTQSRLVGHNTAFDALFTYCALRPKDSDLAVDASGRIRRSWRRAQRQLNAIADAFVYDTWHMAYTRRQARGSLGLEILAYDFVPELAGYEEDFVLLRDLEAHLLHPDRGGHYARCPRDKWESHLKPYAMGDVEVCYRMRDELQEALGAEAVYKFPLANPQGLGRFRYFTPPSRAWLYENIMSPANRLLTKMMGRGLFVDLKALADLEQKLPKSILDSVQRMRNVGNGEVLRYIEQKMAEDEHRNDPEKCWEFDLEKKDQLREVLFERLRLGIQRLTKTGRKMYGEVPENWDDNIIAAIRAENPTIKPAELQAELHRRKLSVAALDKFTLNRLAVDHEEVRPLQDYRRVFKLYSTYVRPLRNMLFEGIDKKARTAAPHLCPDGAIHAQFMLTGTRGGRLSCRNPNLQQLPKEGIKSGAEILEIKKMYASRFGRRGCLYGSDFSQIELRLLAAASGDPTMVDAYFKDIDLHTLTTSRIFKLDYEAFSKDHMKWLEENGKASEAKELKLKRDIGKTVNFLTGYGGGAFGLQNVLAGRQIYRTIEECERIIATFFDSYPAVRDLLSYYKRFIYDKQAAVSIFGRVRLFEEVRSADPEAESKALRAGCNHLIQSTASDMMLICLVVIEQMMREEGLDSMLVSTVHDSLVVDALREELPKVHEIVTSVLNNMPEVFKMVFGEDYDTSWMIVPFAGDAEIGKNYGSMRAIARFSENSEIDYDRVLDDSSLK